MLDSDSNSSPESLQDNDDVIFVEHTLNGLTIPDRGKHDGNAIMGILLFHFLQIKLT